ncbi:hypothetical protein BC777_2931 [Yoonia maricola]|uniref:Uncharacterized protein n=1 Tax=Yoonia maricola TaxID=420999 RepID=A0A2M8W208_9RHOB|nr:hypothetical protein [Yoonia maricola]PJI84938.1 hypothetical protein BC777_2931 [Yoonia maricola]
MSSVPDDTPFLQLGLAQTLRQTGRSVMQLGEIVLDLEHQILDDYRQVPQAAGRVQNLQALDFLKQATDEIAALLDRLADATPEGLTVGRANISDPMKLQDLRDAICQTETLTKQQDRQKSHEEIELF